MTTAFSSTNSAHPGTPQSGLKMTQRRVIASEWTKFQSLRSTRWTLVIAVVLTVGVGAMMAAVAPSQYDQMDAGRQASFDSTTTSLTGVLFSQLAMGVLGVMVIAVEYSTGMIRSTLTVIPRRLPMLWAKLAVFAGVTFFVTLIASLVAFFLGQALMGSHNLDVSLSAPGASGKILGAAVYVTLSGIIGIAVGSLLRHTAAGISTYVGVVLILPLMAGFLPASFSDHVVQYLPSNAGSVMFSGPGDIAHPLSPSSGFTVLLAYAIVLIGAAAWRLKTRDA